MQQFVFFFQAEDGIRDTSVTGVQTCALPICGQRWSAPSAPGTSTALRRHGSSGCASRCSSHWRHSQMGVRSEERRVGKDGRMMVSVALEKKSFKKPLHRYEADTPNSAVVIRM